jgi:Zn-dependent metalloprotease/uncharacterized protein YegL
MNRKRRNSLTYVVIGGIAIVLFVMGLALASGSGNTGTPQPLVPTQPGTSNPAVGEGVFPGGVDGNLDARQQAGFNKLSQVSSEPPYVQVEMGTVRFGKFSVNIPNSTAATPEEKARYFLQTYGDLFDLPAGASQFANAQVESDSSGSQITFAQQVGGIPVYASNLIVHLDGAGNVTSVNGGYIPGNPQTQTPALQSQQAEKIAKDQKITTNPVLSGDPLLVYYDPAVFAENISRPTLAWLVSLDTENGNWDYLIDAKTGIIIKEISTRQEAINREIWECNPVGTCKTNGLQLNATKVMDEQSTIKGQSDEAKAAFDNIGKVYDFYKTNFGRDSYNNSGAKIIANVKLTEVNAYWKPGDECDTIKNLQALGVPGKNEFFLGTHFAEDVEVVAHEFTHGVVQETVCLFYSNESGALNESFADVFATLIENEDNWTMGENLVRMGVKIPTYVCEGDYIRDLKDPQNCTYSYTDPNSKNKVLIVEPRNYLEYKNVTKAIIDNNNKPIDNGGVHIINGIPSRAAYLIAEGGISDDKSITITKVGRQKLGYIYYETLFRKYLHHAATFADARNGILAACVRLIGQHDIKMDDCYQIMNAWAAVGVGKPAISVPPPLLPSGGSSTTMMVLDASGSMNSPDPSGQTKILAAEAAGTSVLDILSAEKKASPFTFSQVGILHFNQNTNVDYPIGTDFPAAQNTLASIVANYGTGMPDGLKQALDLIAAKQDKYKPIIILLSDGMPNIGLGGASSGDVALAKNQSLDLAQQAGSSGVCIYTVGFGNPSAPTLSNEWIDEQFLKDMAAASKCGAYYSAQDARQLNKVFIEVRHTSTGNILLDQDGQISQNEKVAIGMANVQNGQDMALFTLNWPGSQLDPILTDPSGRAVDSTYPAASISTTNTMATVIIQNPKPGQWQVGALGVNVPEGRTTYSAIFSTRAGKVIPPKSQYGMGFVLLVLAVTGGGVAVYALQRNRKRILPAKPGPKARLIGMKADGEKIDVDIFDGYLIGRGTACHLQLPDLNVSRVHAQLRYSQGAWYIQDRGSTGGTWINGQRVNAAGLHTGDRIQIGATQLEFRL